MSPRLFCLRARVGLRHKLLQLPADELRTWRLQRWDRCVCGAEEPFVNESLCPLRHKLPTPDAASVGNI